jgi:glycosyltransferase involved in cell wall biosynthesis
MNVLSLSFDHALLCREAAAHTESRQRQVAYAAELRRRAPGSRLWIIVRAAAGMPQGPVTVSENLEVIPTPSSPAGFIVAAWRHGRRLCQQHGIDLITSQSPFSDGLVAWLLRSWSEAKWLAQLHTSTFDNRYWLSESRANRLRAGLGKFLLRRADGVRVVSETAARWLREGLHVPQDRLFVIPVGTGLVSLASAPQRHASGANIVFVGRLVPQKGIATLLRGFRRVERQSTEATLVVVGDGPSRQSLQKLASTLGLGDRVRFVGWVPHERLCSFYSQADIVVVPSLYEPYGRVIAEAMSFGCPVVATDTEGARDLIRDGETGFIVPIEDAGALADKILHLLANPRVAREIGRAARQFARRTQDPHTLFRAQVGMWLKVAAQ